jgi:hypothetical protein
MRFAWMVVPLLACSSEDLRVVVTDDGPYEGHRVWAELADLDANEAIELQRGRMDDGAHEFVFAGARAQGVALALTVQVEAASGTGCGPAIVESVDGVQVGALELDTADFTDFVCLGAPQEEETSSD